MTIAWYVPSCELFEIDPTQITIERAPQQALVKLQKQMSKAIWRPSPGRNMGFVIGASGRLIGIMMLSSPVMFLGPRDKFLKLPEEPSARGYALREYMDMSICVGSQPVSWYWNIGKLIALLATTLGQEFSAEYTEDTLKGITTTSLYGKGSQYNRIYKFLGYTQGYGHEHISDAEYHKMTYWLGMRGLHLPEHWSGQNRRMRTIQLYRKESGDKSVNVHHGHLRGIYYHEAVPPESRAQVISDWYARWGRPRFERKRNELPPYTGGLASDSADRQE